MNRGTLPWKTVYDHSISKCNILIYKAGSEKVNSDRVESVFVPCGISRVSMGMEERGLMIMASLIVGGP